MNKPGFPFDVMVLAAGRGERLRPLTDTTPKPLIEVGGQMLIEHPIRALSNIGVERVIINTAHLAQTIHERLGDGSRYGVEIVYSDEPAGALETAGGLVHALPLFHTERLLVINGDIYTDYDFASLIHQPERAVHLVLVENPAHHANGDFALSGNLVTKAKSPKTALTFSGISVYNLKVLRELAPGRRALASLFFALADKKQLTGEYYAGKWTDVGTIERLEQLRAELADDAGYPASKR